MWMVGMRKTKTHLDMRLCRYINKKCLYISRKKLNKQNVELLLNGKSDSEQEDTNKAKKECPYCYCPYNSIYIVIFRSDKGS